MKWSASTLDGDAAVVTLQGSEVRLELVGNPHTAAGHFSVVDPRGMRSTARLAEVTGATVAAAAWIAGFLSGSEPFPPDFDDEADARWRAARDGFLATGSFNRPERDDIRRSNEKLNALAEGLGTPRDFAVFLRALAWEWRLGIDDWARLPDDYFLIGWAETIESSEDEDPPSSHPALVADWASLGRSLVETLFEVPPM